MLQCCGWTAATGLPPGTTSGRQAVRAVASATVISFLARTAAAITTWPAARAATSRA
jgi:hypothetical protein